MPYVIGIDTGGTYTDAVLLDTKMQGSDCVRRKSKALTTHDNLEIGIRNSIAGLNLSDGQLKKIEKVVLSTTLATNAVVEEKLGTTGLLMIGGKPVGSLATDLAVEIQGKVNIKGKILRDIDKEEVKRAADALLPKVEAFAVSGQASVRNPILEQKVKSILNDISDLPVVCGHELVSNLGYLERTNTAVVNASLLSVIDRFVTAIKEILKEQNIKAPVFVVKGDGTIAKIDFIRRVPVDTVLSGPAASIVGAISLTGAENAIVADMGGTTTDIGTVHNKRVELSKDGAVVGKWHLRIKSAKLYTYGLGGDSEIRVKDGKPELTPYRGMPACRGGEDVTPTDILHYTGEFVGWNRRRSIEAIAAQAASADMTADEYVSEVKNTIANKVYENLKTFRKINYPICAIGAPAESWYRITREKSAFDLIVPTHYEVANAVGAAASGVSIESEAVIRVGEMGGGYLLHSVTERSEFDEFKDALKRGIEVTREHVVGMIKEQNLQVAYIHYDCRNMYMVDDQIVYREIDAEDEYSVEAAEQIEGGRYLETQIRIQAAGKIFAED